MASNPVTPVPSGGGGGGSRRGLGGSMAPEHIVSLVQSEVGKMKAEIEKDLDGKLTTINTRLDKLPGTVTFVVTIVSALGVAFALLFAILSWSDNREEHVSDKSATIAITLQKLSDQTAENTKALQDLKHGETNSDTGKGKKQTH